MCYGNTIWPQHEWSCRRNSRRLATDAEANAPSAARTTRSSKPAQQVAPASGPSAQEVNNLLKQHAQMSKMFETMGSGGIKMQQRLMSQLGGGQRFGR